jgi:hypothetical protein
MVPVTNGLIYGAVSPIIGNTKLSVKPLKSGKLVRSTESRTNRLVWFTKLKSDLVSYSDSKTLKSEKLANDELLKSSVDTLWKREDLAVHLNCALRTVDQLTADGVIPVIKLSKRMVRYQPTEVLKVLERYTVKGMNG